MKAWARLKIDEQLFSTIMQGLRAAKRSPQWAKDGGQFIVHPATWLNDRRWEDEVSAPLGQEVRRVAADY